MPVSAHQFAGESARFNFGTSKEKSAQALRFLADAIESGAVLVQSVRVSSFASNEDFTLTGIRMVLAEEYTPPSSGAKALYAGTGFPVDVAQTS